jgi:integrase
MIKVVKKPKRVGKFKFTVKGVSGATLLETRVKGSDGLFAVVNQLTYKQDRQRYKTYIRLSLEQWNNIEDPQTNKLKGIRNDIQTKIDKLREIIEGMESFNFAEFNKRYGKGKTALLLEAFELKAQRLTKLGRINTASYYDVTHRCIKKFTYPEVRISDITVDWLERFEAWMINQGMSYTTVAMYEKAIKAIINEYGNGLNYPFGEGLYQIPKSSGRRIALSLEQIGKIASAPLISDTDRMCRDLWMFMFLCNGINLNDMLRLRYSDIVGDEMRWTRRKTLRENRDKSQTIAYYLPEMREIVTLWGKPQYKPSDFIFPYLHDKNTPLEENRIIKNFTRLINRKMTLIGKRLGIGRISSYSARHSFSNIQMQSGASVAYISKALSHSNIKTTETYLGSFTSEAIKKQAKELTKYKK